MESIAGRRVRVKSATSMWHVRMSTKDLELLLVWRHNNKSLVLKMYLSLHGFVNLSVSIEE